MYAFLTQYSIYDLNTWFYDGIMPEYMFHNHEMLCGAGTNGIEWFKFQAGFWAKFLPAYFALLAGILITTSLHPNLALVQEDLPLEKILEASKTEKLGLKPDWLGTSKD